MGRSGHVLMDEKGIVYLVGAGPGRPDLITVRGLDLIRQADCLICDRLAHPALLAYANQVAVYTAESTACDGRKVIEQIQQGRILWLTFASASEARAFFEQVPVDFVVRSRVKVASIGPVTSRQLGQLGLTVDVEARDHTIEGLIQAMIGSSR